MWELEPTELFERDRKHYEKKHPREFSALKENLKRYLKLLEAAPNNMAVQAGFLHSETGGVLAIDQKGGGQGLQESRLYTFADDKTHRVWLITIGNKKEQPGDVQICRKFVDSLRGDEDAEPEKEQNITEGKAP